MTAEAGQARGSAGAAYGGKTGAAAVKIDRSNLTNVGSGPLDYANPALWACRPGNDPDECDINLDATEILKDGSYKVVPHVRAVDPKVDCFYMYPTVYFDGGNMTNFSDLAAVRDPIASQAARFTRVCRVFAPLYRQVSTSIDLLGTAQFSGDIALATRDVLAAFDHYVSTLSEGRRFVIVAHSQGSVVGTSLVQQRIDNDPALRARMVSAILLGGDLRAPAGQPVGGSFKNIPACTMPGQTSCLIAYSSYDKLAPPDQDSLYSRASDAGSVICTEPAALAGRSGNYGGSYFPSSVYNLFYVTPGFFPADLTTPFMLYRDYFHGQCVERDGLSYLEISIATSADDKRQAPPYRSPLLELSRVGLHLVDYNLPMDDLLTALTLQANTTAH